MTEVRLTEEFQFPSNGKVDPNNEHQRVCLRELPSFNSLQTGKWILTWRYYNETETISQSFNSLQTGKWILTRPSAAYYGSGNIVSIPFKRESGS